MLAAPDSDWAAWAELWTLKAVTVYYIYTDYAMNEMLLWPILVYRDGRRQQAQQR